jgi:hypothetical protein
MKITKSQLREIIREELEKLKEGVGEYTIKKTKVYKSSDTDGGDDDDWKGDDDVVTEYDILLNGKRVGELVHGSYFGGISGTLHGKSLPELSGYGKNKSSGPLSSLHSFLKSNTGKRWFKNVKI